MAFREGLKRLKSPFQIHAVYTTKFGLLVERDLSYMGASAEDQVSLYSLSHPLNELLAVIFKPRGTLKGSSCGAELF